MNNSSAISSIDIDIDSFPTAESVAEIMEQVRYGFFDDETIRDLADSAEIIAQIQDDINHGIDRGITVASGKIW